MKRQQPAKSAKPIPARIVRKPTTAPTPTQKIIPVAQDLELTAPSLASQADPMPSQTVEILTPPPTPSPSANISHPPQNVDSPITPLSEITPNIPTPEMNRLKSNHLLFMLGTGFTVGIIAASIGIFFFWQAQPSAQKQVVTPTEITTVSPTPSPKLDKSLWVFEVLNGSGVAGRATQAAKTLETRGYVVESTGNATTRNFSQTLVYTTESLAQEASALLEDLRLDFKTATLSGIFFEPTSDSTATAQIIIGSN